jgi:hypothetical protein
MNILRRRVCSLGLVILLLGLAGSIFSSVLAAAYKPPPVIDKRILIKAVDVDKQQVTFQFKRNGKTQDYTIDDRCQVMIGNLPGSIKEIKVGQEVFSYIERDHDALDSITVDKADPAPTQ